ncbi:MAG: hypothetical protein V2I33_20920 [Kangiellaceae bacterium]|nr:hypothetical protein [Kangiellaceae bacterium]
MGEKVVDVVFLGLDLRLELLDLQLLVLYNLTGLHLDCLLPSAHFQDVLLALPQLPVLECHLFHRRRQLGDVGLPDLHLLSRDVELVLEPDALLPQLLDVHLLLALRELGHLVLIDLLAQRVELNVKFRVPLLLLEVVELQVLDRLLVALDGVLQVADDGLAVLELLVEGGEELFGVLALLVELVDLRVLDLKDLEDLEVLPLLLLALLLETEVDELLKTGRLLLHQLFDLLKVLRRVAGLLKLQPELRDLLLKPSVLLLSCLFLSGRVLRLTELVGNCVVLLLEPPDPTVQLVDILFALDQPLLDHILLRLQLINLAL